MEPTTEIVPAKRSRTEIRKETQISEDTMLDVLLWLNRFDLDVKQITSRRLRALVEHNRMPLRTVVVVEYNGKVDRERKSNNIMSIHLNYDDPPEVEFKIETDADAQKAASYLASCFVLRLIAYDHRSGPPRNAIIAAPARICNLDFDSCDFRGEEENTLSEALNGSTVQCVSIRLARTLAGWQINDNLLKSLRHRGCNELLVYHSIGGAEKFHVTEQGILRYCFALDDGLAMPETRVLVLEWANVTASFFKELANASKNSRLTCSVELRLENLRLDVMNLDIGVTPSRGREYDRSWNLYLHTVRYDIADHGNGMRLLIDFKSVIDDQDWDVTVRHGPKDHEEFFGWPKDE